MTECQFIFGMGSTIESDYSESLNAFREKLNRIEELTQNKGGSVRIFISNHFYALRNDIDIEFEELILLLKAKHESSDTITEDESQLSSSDVEGECSGCQVLATELRSLDRMRRELICEIDKHELNCLENCQTESFFARLRSSFQQRIESYQAFIAENDEQNVQELSRRTKFIDKDLQTLKTEFLLRRTYIMKKFPYPSSLLSSIELYRLIIVDHGLSENQVEFFRKKNFLHPRSTLDQIIQTTSEAENKFEIEQSHLIIWLLFEKLHSQGLAISVRFNDIRLESFKLNSRNSHGKSSLVNNLASKAFVHLKKNEIEQFFQSKIEIIIDDLFYLNSINSNLFSGDAFKFLKIVNLTRTQLEILTDEYNHNESHSIFRKDSGLFSSLKSLKELNVYGNTRLKAVRQSCLIKNSNLTKLNLKQNQLTVVYDDENTNQPKHLFENLVNLTDLDLSLNKIDSLFIPNAAISSPFSKSLDNLKCLNLNSNRIKVLRDRVFKNLPSLEELYLGYNCIDTINENAFDGLESLKKLILTSNRIKSFHDNTFCALKSLEILYLSSNRIERLNKNFFHGLASISGIYLLNNPIRSFNKLELLDSRYTMSNQVKIFI